MMRKKLSISLICLLMFSACSSMTPKEKVDKRAALDLMTQTAIDGLIAEDESLQTKIDNALAVAVANMKVTKVPIVGAGGGEGVFVNNQTSKRSYFTVSRFDIGGGWGARSYKVLMLLNTQEMLERMEGGTWEFQSGVEASVGTAAAEGSAGATNEGFTLHVLSDGGASATATARVIRIKVDSELTE